MIQSVLGEMMYRTWGRKYPRQKQATTHYKCQYLQKITHKNNNFDFWNSKVSSIDC